jgi:tetratricopeptide (TPR) repeat protein
MIIITCIFCLLFLLRFFALNYLSYDSWIHFALGRFIVEKLRIPDHTDISYKSVEPAMEFVTHSWLADIAFFVSDAISHQWGPVALLIAVLIVTLFLLNEVLGLLRVPKNIRTLCIALAIFGVSSFWRIHPLLFTPFLSLLALWGYLDYKRGTNRIILLTPIVFFVWANVAGGYIVLLGLLYVSFIAGEVLGVMLGHKTRLLILLLSTLLGLGASLINPLGIRIWIYLFTILALMGAQKGPSTLVGAISLLYQNYVKSPPTPLFYTFFLFYSLQLLFLFLVSIMKRLKQTINRSYLFVPVFISFFFAYQWVRLIPLALVMSLPLFAVLFEQFLMIIPQKYARLTFYVFGIGIGILMTVVIVNPPRITPSLYPSSQVQLVKRYRLSPHVLTTQEYAGYVFYSLFPQKVFIDAQDDLLDDNEVLTFYSSPPIVEKKILASIIDDNTINTAITSRDLNYLGSALHAQKNWTLLYFDESGYLLAKTESLSSLFIEKYALTQLYLNSNLGFDSLAADETIQDLKRYLTLYPHNPLALGQLATVYRIQQKFDLAEKTLFQFPTDKKDFSYMVEMGRLKAAQGLCKSSEEWYLKALSVKKEQLYSQAVLDLAVLYGGCFQDKVKAKHYFARYNSFVLPQNERERVRQLAEQFGIQLVDE